MSNEIRVNSTITITETEEKKLSNYQFTQTIGQGNFGKVKLAVFKPTKESFAVKIINKEQIQSKNEMNLVQRQLKIIRHFNHINVIYVHQIIEDKKNFYIVMDYCESGELFDYITLNQHLNEDEAALFFYQLINGIEYIHSKRIVHRDLKPENLLLTKNKTLKIIDFGLSRCINSDTILSTKCGSPSYAAPEIITNTEYNGYRTDIWCCGIILYAMLCGYLPFEGDNNKELFKNIIEGNIEFPEYVTRDGRKMVREMLNPNHEERIGIRDIKTRVFYLKGKEVNEGLLGNRRKKKVKGLHIVNSNSEVNVGIGGLRKSGLIMTTMTKGKVKDKDKAKMTINVNGMYSPKNKPIAASITSKIANILKTDTMLFHKNIKGHKNKNKNQSNSISNSNAMNKSNSILSSQMTPKDSQRLFRMKLNHNFKCPLNQLLINSNYNSKLNSKDKDKSNTKSKSNLFTLTIPDKASNIASIRFKPKLNLTSNSKPNIHIATITTTNKQSKNTRISNYSLPTEPKEFDEYLKLKFKNYIITKSNMQREERKTKLGDSFIMRSKSKENNALLSHKNQLPKLTKC